jgi:prepilin-type N-terminal cleavage/methylation domain-containing protein/prepilin-type processing-associated H-X9-DG protein
MNANPADRHRGFTVIELMVALGIIGVLAAILLPAIAQAREVARRATCRNHLRQIGIAIQSYESAHGCFPPAGVGLASSYLCRLLPYVEAGNLIDLRDQAINESLDAWYELRSLTPPVFRCPSDPGAAQEGFSSYAGNSGNGAQPGVFKGFFRYLDGFGSDPGGVIRAQDVDRGLSRTAAVSEFLTNDKSGARERAFWEIGAQDPDQPELFASACRNLPANPAGAGITNGVSPLGGDWTNFNLGLTLYNHMLAPNSPRCNFVSSYQLSCMPAGSTHPGGAHTLYGDGHCEFTGNSVDLGVWRQVGSRTSRQVTTP